MMDEFLGLIDRIVIPLATILGIIICYIITKRYIRLLRMFSDCRQLAKIHNGEIIKKHLIFTLVFIPRKGADILMKFSSEKSVAVKLICLKPKTTVRFTDDNTMEYIRYRRAIGLQGENKGLTPSYRVMGAKGIDAEPLIRKRKIVFWEPENVKKLLFFTNEPSDILVYDGIVKNYRIIGEGESAFSYIVCGYRFIKKWMKRNNH